MLQQLFQHDPMHTHTQPEKPTSLHLGFVLCNLLCLLPYYVTKLEG